MLADDSSLRSLGSTPWKKGKALTASGKVKLRGKVRQGRDIRKEAIAHKENEWTLAKVKESKMAR